MVTQLELAGIAADVIKKDIRNVHLSVYLPTGKVRISAPLRMDLSTIRLFAIAKLGWIRQQQMKVNAQPRETPREYLERESHYLWGKRYLLKIEEHDAPPEVELRHKQIVLRLRPNPTPQKKQAILDDWYRTQLKTAAPALIAKWERLIGVKLDRFYIQRMKTKWGSCSRTTPAIRLNTDLARKPKESLEYIIVHELAHLREPTHNARFTTLMDQLLPDWRHRRDQLNQLPVRHETWDH